ncbi:MAG: hypothetical protein FWH03_00750 [Firmicutes bacterium]|nr:hypothetical protein [Bacillota bacterium]
MPKYKYKFCDGTSCEVEVTDEQFALLKEMDKQEHNSNFKHKRKSTSLEVLQEQENTCKENDKGVMKK